MGPLPLAVPTPVVDRIWFDGGPAIEPSAVMLDLALRGSPPPETGKSARVAVVISGNTQVLADVGYPGELRMVGHGYTIALATDEAVHSWSKDSCKRKPKVGGAWDGLTIFQPTGNGCFRSHVFTEARSSQKEGTGATAGPAAAL